MLFHPTKLSGVWLIGLEPIRDERGFFARTFCSDAFNRKGLETSFVQHSTSYTQRAGTIRGMHHQRPPHAEVKLLGCVRGAIHDVLIDIRPQSPTYLQWEAYRLDADNRLQLYVPAGIAHGFQSLQPDTEVHYLISVPHNADASAGIRHDDPAFAIEWPLPLAEISAKDRSWPPFIA